MLDDAHFFQQLLVGDVKRRITVIIMIDQSRTDKNLPGGFRLHMVVGNLAPGLQRQSVQQSALRDHTTRAFLFPMRVVIVVLDQMPGALLYPFRFYPCDRARIHLAGFNLLRRHDPLGLYFVQTRTRKNKELQAASAQVFVRVMPETDT